MKKLLLFAAIIGMFTACDKGDDNVQNFYQAPSGTADITLTTTPGGTEFKLNGPCGWAYAAGVGYVGANQLNDSSKAFSIDTNLTELPTETTTFTITNDIFDEDPLKVSIHFIDFEDSGYTSFDGFIGSGTVTFVVEGNKVTVNLAGVTLRADDANDAPYNQDGALTGTLTFYR